MLMLKAREDWAWARPYAESSENPVSTGCMPVIGPDDKSGRGLYEGIRGSARLPAAPETGGEVCRRGSGESARMSDILFVKTSSLGDVIHHMPALTGARRHLPHARYSWVVEQQF